MPNQGVTQQLYSQNGKISELTYAPSLSDLRIITKVEQAIASGQGQACPSNAFISQSHNFIFTRAFKPAIKVAFEYVDTCCKSGGTFGQKFCFEPKFTANYLNDAYFNFTMPEMSCNEAVLPDIIVTPSDADVFALNGNLALNFGTGALASVAETNNNVIVRRGFCYDMVTAAPAPSDTEVVINGVTYTLRTAASGLGGVGSISYVYEDEFGNFIAGPNGEAVAPDENGFGEAGAGRVTRANYVVAADRLGIKLCNETRFSVDQCEIDKYSKYHLLNNYELRMSKYCQKQNYDDMIGQEVAEERPRHSLRTHGDISATGGHEGVPSCQYSREYRKYASGLQTPKPVQPSTRLTIPLAFEHNTETFLSLPIAIIPDTDLVYEVDTAPLDELYYPTFGSTFIRETVMLYPGAAPGAAVGTRSDPRKELSRKIPVLIPNSNVKKVVCPSPSASMTARFLYLTELEHLCMINRLHFDMIHIQRDNKLTLKTDDEECLELCNTKFPTEYFIVRDTAPQSTDESRYDVHETWYRLGHVLKTPAPEYYRHTDNVIDQAGNTSDFVHLNHMTQYDVEMVFEPIITNMSVSIYDSEIYQMLPRSFYENYTTFAVGGDVWYHEADGLAPLVVNFSMKPGLSSFWGSVGSSRNRKISLRVLSQCEPSKTQMPDGIVFGSVSNEKCCNKRCEIYVTACLINFILGSDGSLQLRFA